MTAWRIWLPSLAFTMALGVLGGILLNVLDISATPAGLIFFGLVVLAV